MTENLPRKRKPRTPKEGRIDQTKSAFKIIGGKFGGLARYCEISGDSPSTVDGWLVRGKIPKKRWAPIIELGAAQTPKIAIVEADFA